MNEEFFSIVVSQKKDIDNLEDYVNAGFKVICDWGKKDHRSLVFLSVCFGAMVCVMHHHDVKIKKLEKQLKELKEKDVVVEAVDRDPLEKVAAE